MPKLKVKPLEWYMEYEPEELAEEGYTPLPDYFKLVGRDGYYCRGDFVWFEVDGVGYQAYPRAARGMARQYFCYDFEVNNEAILPEREVVAMNQVLKTCRDAQVKKAINRRLRLHENAIDLRDSGRRAALTRIKILGK